jgi:hypothetical protein
LRKPSHIELQNRFNEAVTRVEGDSTVTNLPNLEVPHGLFHLESVEQATDLDGNSYQKVFLGCTDRPWLAFSLDYQDSTWKLSPELADKLNDLLVIPDCDEGKVGLERYTDDKYEATRPLTDEEKGWLGLTPDGDGYYGSVDEHPEGSDRGGYVPTLAAGPHYDEGGGEWQG